MSCSYSTGAFQTQNLQSCSCAAPDVIKYVRIFQIIILSWAVNPDDEY